jgi:hypothetical protein
VLLYKRISLFIQMAVGKKILEIIMAQLRARQAPGYAALVHGPRDTQ